MSLQGPSSSRSTCCSGEANPGVKVCGSFMPSPGNAWRAALLEEGFHADAEGRQVLLRDARIRLAVRAQRERRGQVLLDRDRHLILVMSEVHEREAAGGEKANDAVVLEPRAYGNRLVDLPARLVGLGRHLLL